MDIMESRNVICKLVYLLKRSTDEWINGSLCCGSHAEFNTAHVPLFMSIGTTGISNNELAKKLQITKQAASKVIKELEAIQLVKSEKNQTDARSVMLYLTADGEKFYHHLINQVAALENEYKKAVGEENYQIAIKVMQQLITYHGQTANICAPIESN